MELGLTIPLQRHLKRSVPPCVPHQAPMLCWDLHMIALLGRQSLLAVHCYSRYTFVLFDLSDLQWTQLSATFLSGLRGSLASAGISQKAIEDYLCRAGECCFTRTHGRREVAFLNRAWEDVMALDYCLDQTSQDQPLLDHAINSKPSRCAGCEGLSPAAQRLKTILG